MDGEKVEEFLGRLLVDLHGLDVELHDRHRPPDRLVRGRGPGPGDERGARGPRRAHRALRARVAGRDGDGRHLRLRAGDAALLAATRAGRVPHRRRDQPGADGVAAHASRQARASGRARLPRGRRRSLRRVPARVHRRDGRHRARHLRRVAHRRVPPARAGARRAARSRARASPTSRAAPGTRSCCWPGRFPASTFVGYDLDEGAIARARAEAGGAGLTNVRFEVCDAARLEVEQPFDVVFVFDADPRSGRSRPACSNGSTPRSSTAVAS